jgi:hypothetical protein
MAQTKITTIALRTAPARTPSPTAQAAATQTGEIRTAARKASAPAKRTARKAPVRKPAERARVAAASTCGDPRCTDGVTWCATCHGWGVLNPSGKAYRMACKALPVWAVRHEMCNGTGTLACGCRKLDEATTLALMGTDPAVSA